MDFFPEWELPKIGTLVRLKRGTRAWEFRGQYQEGKILLYDPLSGITNLIRTEEIIWKPHKALKPIRP